jgi:hypothetical protein
MDNITYDVRIWKTEIYKGTRVSTYKVRWKTGPRPWKRPFRTKAQAASFEAELRSAARRGEAFDITTGCPVSWGREDSGMSWYDFCVSSVDMKWKGCSGHHRANVAWTLVTVLPSMLASDRGSPDEMAMRTALRQWGFNTKQRCNCPDDAAAILSWVSRNTKPVAALADPAAARAVLDAAGTARWPCGGTIYRPPEPDHPAQRTGIRGRTTAAQPQSHQGHQLEGSEDDTRS